MTILGVQSQVWSDTSIVEAQGVLGVPSGVRLGREDLPGWWVAGPIGTAFRQALILSARADIER